MDFRKKLNVRLYTSICILCVGIIMVISSFFGADDMVSSFGAMFVVIGVARIAQYRRITKDEDSLHRREVAETDERKGLRKKLCKQYLTTLDKAKITGISLI